MWKEQQTLLYAELVFDNLPAPNVTLLANVLRNLDVGVDSRLTIQFSPSENARSLLPSLHFLRRSLLSFLDEDQPSYLTATALGEPYFTVEGLSKKGAV
jgi:hypothetical protein